MSCNKSVDWLSCSRSCVAWNMLWSTVCILYLQFIRYRTGCTNQSTEKCSIQNTQTCLKSANLSQTTHLTTVINRLTSWNRKYIASSPYRYLPLQTETHFLYISLFLEALFSHKLSAAYTEQLSCWFHFNVNPHHPVLASLTHNGEVTLNGIMTCVAGRAMAQAVSRRSLTTEARVRSRVSPCEICDGQSGTGTGFSPSCQFSPVNFIPLVLHYL
jgi:hypothetical protein